MTTTDGSDGGAGGYVEKMYAGDYRYGVELKDKVNWRWTDGSTTNLVYTWSILPRTLTPPALPQGLVYAGTNAVAITDNSHFFNNTTDSVTNGVFHVRATIPATENWTGAQQSKRFLIYKSFDGPLTDFVDIEFPSYKGEAREGYPKTKIRMYWHLQKDMKTPGPSPEDVWSDYAGVWHFGEEIGTNFIFSGCVSQKGVLQNYWRRAPSISKISWKNTDPPATVDVGTVAIETPFYVVKRQASEGLYLTNSLPSEPGKYTITFYIATKPTQIMIRGPPRLTKRQFITLNNHF